MATPSCDDPMGSLRSGELHAGLRHHLGVGNAAGRDLERRSSAWSAVHAAQGCVHPQKAAVCEADRLPATGVKHKSQARTPSRRQIRGFAVDNGHAVSGCAAAEIFLLDGSRLEPGSRRMTSFQANVFVPPECRESPTVSWPRHFLARANVSDASSKAADRQALLLRPFDVGGCH